MRSSPFRRLLATLCAVVASAGILTVLGAQPAHAMDTWFTVVNKSHLPMVLTAAHHPSDPGFAAGSPEVGTVLTPGSSQSFNATFWWARDNDVRVSYDIPRTGEEVNLRLVPATSIGPARASCADAWYGLTGCTASGTTVTVAPTQPTSYFVLTNNSDQRLEAKAATTVSGRPVLDGGRILPVANLSINPGGQIGLHLANDYDDVTVRYTVGTTGRQLTYRLHKRSWEADARISCQPGPSTGRPTYACTEEGLHSRVVGVERLNCVQPRRLVTVAFHQAVTAAYREEFRRAMLEWSERTDVHFTEVPWAVAHDVTVQPSATAPGTGLPTYALTTRFSCSVPGRNGLDAHIFYNYRNPALALPAYRAVVYNGALHELGHALGLGHMDAWGSIMHPEGDDTPDANLVGLVPYDVAAIKALYAGVPST